jgi:hypothetical protein
MEPRERRRVTVAIGALALLCTAGCAAKENIDVTNDSEGAVTVQLGDEDLGEVGSRGGVVLLGTTDCYDGPIVVTFADESVVELDGPICPGETLAVGRATARIVHSASVD